MSAAMATTKPNTKAQSNQTNKHTKQPTTPVNTSKTTSSKQIQTNNTPQKTHNIQILKSTVQYQPNKPKTIINKTTTKAKSVNPDNNYTNL